MNIAVLGGGVEGQAVKTYFTPQGDHVQIFDNFTDADIPSFHLEDYDLVFRSPSVHPQYLLDTPALTPWTSITRYFFDHCPAPIIGITGTKGKGTTCSLTRAILEEIIKTSAWPSRKVHLVGNIGAPAISVLDEVQPDDVVIYEMSSFQLWDLDQSPHIAAVLRIEPDHLDRHPDFDDYVTAKSHIVSSQTPNDYCIYYAKNDISRSIAEKSPAQKLAYPPELNLDELLNHLHIPGAHNRENASAAILIASACQHQPLETFIAENRDSIITALENFRGLPHRLEFVRNLNNVDYYDDNYSSAYPAMDVAIAAFADRPTVLIAGGKDRHLDLTETKRRLATAENLRKVILIGETKSALAADEDPAKFTKAESLEEAVTLARQTAESLPGDPVVVMSPGAASFDMFENFGDRGEKFQKIVQDF